MPAPGSSPIKTVGIVGGGVIGSGWAARCLAAGLDVIVSDPAPNAESATRASVANAWPALTRIGLKAGADQKRMTFAKSVAEAASKSDFVQESAPERIDLKRKLHAEIDAHARPDVIIASSSSGLLPSEFQADCKHPGRVLVGHPFNPVYLLPLCEVLGGKQTDAAAIDNAMKFYTSIGMRALKVRKEIDGYIADRLQEALWREILHLVNDGIATTGEIDDAIRYGPGLRWAFMGTNLIYHLAGGEGGMKHMLEQFGPALDLPWTNHKAPKLTQALIDRMVEGTGEQAKGWSIKELERFRDDCLIRVMEAVEDARKAAGGKAPV
jgi:carnitine 3-dehydrogenase